MANATAEQTHLIPSMGQIRTFEYEPIAPNSGKKETDADRQQQQQPRRSSDRFTFQSVEVESQSEFKAESKDISRQLRYAQRHAHLAVSSFTKAGEVKLAEGAKASEIAVADFMVVLMKGKHISSVDFNDSSTTVCDGRCLNYPDLKPLENCREKAEAHMTRAERHVTLAASELQKANDPRHTQAHALAQQVSNSTHLPLMNLRADVGLRADTKVDVKSHTNNNKTVGIITKVVPSKGTYAVDLTEQEFEELASGKLCMSVTLQPAVPGPQPEESVVAYLTQKIRDEQDGRLAELTAKSADIERMSEIPMASAISADARKQRIRREVVAHNNLLHALSVDIVHVLSECFPSAGHKKQLQAMHVAVLGLISKNFTFVM